MFRFLFLIWFLFHPVHVTLTSIAYIPGKDCFDGFIRLYLDDFLLDCGLQGIEINKTDLQLKDSVSLKSIEKYVNEKLKIGINNNILTGDLKNINISDNQIDIDIMFVCRNVPEIITVKNLMMTGIYSDQSNMIILKVNAFEEGIKLTSQITEQTFKLN
jgi:hypothetical protein